MISDSKTIQSSDIRPWNNGSGRQLAITRDEQTNRVVAVDVFLAPDVEIQVHRSSLSPRSFSFQRYEGVAWVASGSFRAENWVQAVNHSVKQARQA